MVCSTGTMLRKALTDAELACGRAQSSFDRAPDKLERDVVEALAAAHDLVIDQRF